MTFGRSVMCLGYVLVAVLVVRGLGVLRAEETVKGTSLHAIS